VLSVNQAMASSSVDETRSTTAGENSPAVDHDAINWTPILVQVKEPIQAVLTTNGKYNLVFDLVLTNGIRAAVALDHIDCLGDSGTVIQSFSGKILDSGNLEPGETEILFVNLVFDDKEQVPHTISHRVALHGTTAAGEVKIYQYITAVSEVSRAPVVSVSSPLKGAGWVPFGGYASKGGHRRAIMPIDGDLYSAQTYAIDWVRIDKDKYSMRGDPLNCSIYVVYNEPVCAAANGTICAVYENSNDQIPGKPSGKDLVSHLAGNSILEKMDNGYFAMYAHLKPGSIRVRKGESVTRGQELAHVGNTGNTSEPHLHFQVTDKESILGANGVPYVFDSFEVTGRITNLVQWVVEESAAKPHTIQPYEFNGRHTNELPVEGLVINFDK
jgi:hypothetical protein